ncbi:hypothetical protein B4915_01145 [Leucobacter massiliensis]|uniref:2-oxoglutarate dehydrogenase n=1 Tax=Leucobacter massiliensis TaxID=1686285 RepID=A0A2S9QRV7_9MICO|nr:hypothetical protein B4915_01145 [Leucobacter massiliensis]
MRAALAALLALGIIGTSASPALARPAAAVPAPAPAPAQEEGTDGSGPVLVLAPRESVIRENTDLAFEVLLRNPGEDPVPGGRLELRISAAPLRDAAALDAAPPSATLRLAESTLGETAAEGEQLATVSVPQAELPPLSDAGVYVVEGSFVSDAGDAGKEVSLSGTTSLVWRSPGAAAGGTAGSGEGASAASPGLRLAVIVPIVLPSEIRTLPTRRQLEEIVPAWDELLTRARAQEATLAIDPRVIAGIRAYGADVPESASRFLTRLEQSTLPSFLLQFADADPAAQAALGYTSLLAPSSLDFVSRFGDFEPSTPSPTPRSGTPKPEDANGSEAAGGSSASDDAASGAQEGSGSTDATPGEEGEKGDDDAQDGTPSRPQLPSLDELLSWPQGLAAAWPANGAVDSETLALLRDSGLSTVVLGSGNVEGSASRGRIERSEALVTDDALGAAARAALAGATEPERAAGAAELSSRLALAASGGSDPVLLGLDRGAVADASEPAAVLDLLASLDWLSPAPVSALPEGDIELRAGGTDESRLELLRAAAARESSITELGAVLVHPEYLSGYQRARLLDLFATRYADAEAEFETVAAQFRERDSELLGGVRVISTEHTQLVGSSTRLPVQLRNALPFDALVTVEVAPSSAALAVEERRFADVAVAAESNDRLLVPVRSRVSSGESGIVVTVSAASGDPTVFTSTLPVTIRSSFETIALWVLGVLAALLLGFGTWRSVRRRAAGPGGAE